MVTQRPVCVCADSLCWPNLPLPLVFPPVKHNSFSYEELCPLKWSACRFACVTLLLTHRPCRSINGNSREILFNIWEVIVENFGQKISLKNLQSDKCCKYFIKLSPGAEPSKTALLVWHKKAGILYKIIFKKYSEYTVNSDFPCQPSNNNGSSRMFFHINSISILDLFQLS